MLGQFIIIDLEFFKSQKKTEIIQFAAKRVWLDEDNHVIDGDSFKKNVHSSKKPNEKVLNLTHLTLEDWEQAQPFPDVFDEFSKWVDEENIDTIYVSWGNRDKSVLHKELKNYGYKNFQDMSFIDLQSYIMMKDDIPYLPSLYSMVVKEFGEFEGTEHDASADAQNTSKLLKKYL